MAEEIFWLSLGAAIGGGALLGNVLAVCLRRRLSGRWPYRGQNG